MQQIYKEANIMLRYLHLCEIKKKDVVELYEEQAACVAAQCLDYACRYAGR